MKRALQLSLRGARGVLGVLGSFVLWTLWLALVLLLALQLYVLSANELAIPRFALRELESRLAEAGVRATFSRTSFDPTGRVLAENVRISLPAFPEPVVTARSLYIRLNPWMLVVGRVEPREIRVVDASAAVPAMLSPSGRATEIVSHLDATIEPLEKSVVIHQLNATVVGVAVSARGTLVPDRRPGRALDDVIADFVRNRFTTLSRQALELAGRVSQFDQPRLDIELTPSASGAAAVNLTLMATAGRLDQPVAIRATGLRAATRVLLFGENPTSWVQFHADDLQLPDAVRARGVHGDVYGRFQSGAFFFEPRELNLTADSVEAAGVAARSISGQVYPRPLPRIDVAAVARIFDAPLGVRAEADLKQQNARLTLAGIISPAVMGTISERLRVDVRKFFDFTHLALDHGEVRLGERWKFERLDARARIDGINAYGVKMTDGRVVVQLDPQRFYSPDAFARVGENFARGSYEQDLRTLDYRFLLTGRLRPLEISPWFREWWPNFFRQLEFAGAPPAASVDVRGVWKQGLQTSVFVFADAGRSLVRGTEFDRARTRLFIRPGFFDALELSATRGEGLAQGRLTFIVPPDAPAWASFDFAFDSSLELGTLSSILGPATTGIFAPLKVTRAPALKFTGTFTGPGSPRGEHQNLRVEARTSGEFRFHNFPLNDASFVATLKDEELAIDEFEAFVAGGVAVGRARVWGKGDQRRLGFDLEIDEASLGQLAGTVQEVVARQKGLPPPVPGKFVREKANVKMNFAASAEGRYSDPFSFRGAGSTVLQGPEIAEIALLGALSDVLKFTSLRITEANANFKIDGPKVTFPQVRFRGPSAAIDAHGSYALQRQELDFNARVFPFSESENILKTVVGAVLTPLSNFFEVKLGGSLDKPQWHVTLTPANLIRSLVPGDNSAKPETATTPPAATPPATAVPSVAPPPTAPRS